MTHASDITANELARAVMHRWVTDDNLKHVGPLGVEPWRLLFRAHRDGWEMYHRDCQPSYIRRSWANGRFGTYTLDIVRPVR